MVRNEHESTLLSPGQMNFNSGNYLEFDIGCRFEEVNEVSMTTPDQSYTVEQLFDRMMHGLPLDTSIMPTHYDDDEDIDNPDPTNDPDFDIVDAHEQLQQIETKLNTKSSKPKRDEQNDANKVEANG